jgi:threonine/homoserine/homoserine lactone efflux protein
MFGSMIQGLTLGLVLALMAGPVFFLIVNTSIKKGFKPAAYMAAGVVLSDLFFIVLILAGTSRMGNMDTYNYPAGLTGGVLLIVFGLISIFRKPENPSSVKLPDDSRTLLIDTGKGFMMNTLNPFVLIFWIGVIGAMQTGETSWQDNLAFFSAVLVTVFSTDLLKAYLASHLKRILNQKTLTVLNRIAGTGLILFGFQLLYKVLIMKM